jgi:hypothetical protein
VVQRCRVLAQPGSAVASTRNGSSRTSGQAALSIPGTCRSGGVEPRLARVGCTGSDRVSAPPVAVAACIGSSGACPRRATGPGPLGLAEDSASVQQRGHITDAFLGRARTGVAAGLGSDQFSYAATHRRPAHRQAAALAAQSTLSRTERGMEYRGSGNHGDRTNRSRWASHK